MRKLLWRIYGQPLSRIIAAMVLFVLLWGILGCRADKKNWKGLNAAVFLAGLAAVIYTTVATREAGSHEVVLVPFRTFLEAKVQPELYRSMLMNVFLFLPVGLSMPNLFPGEWHPARNVGLTALFGLSLSAAIEWCQYRYGLGRCEIDDVIMNTLGAAMGALGYFLKVQLRKRKIVNQYRIGSEINGS